MTAPKKRTIAVQVSEETHLLFRCLRAATGLKSGELVATALERFTPEPSELEAEVLADVRGYQGVPELVEVKAPVVDPIEQPA